MRTTSGSQDDDRSGQEESRTEAAGGRSLDIVYGSIVDLGAPSGAAEHVVGIAEGLARAGHQVRLVAAGSEENGPVTSRLDCHLVRRDQIGAARSARRVAARIIDVVRDARPDTVYLRTFPMDYPLLTRRLVEYGVPYVVELNTVMGGEYSARGKPLRGRIYDWFLGRSLARARGWVVMSPKLEEYARRVSGARRPTLMAKNGYDPRRLRPATPRQLTRRRLGVDRSDRVLLMAGFSRPWQGADGAISLLAELPSFVRLWLVGDRGEGVVKPLRELASRLGVEERVVFFPWQTQEDLASLIAAADVGLGPLALERKRLVENQPLKIAAYVALGLPVLFNHVDPRFSGKETFFRCVHSSEPAILARELLPLMNLPARSREQACEFARRELTWDVAAFETATFLERRVKQRLRR